MATYGQEQAEKLLKYYQGMSGTMDKPSLMASPEEREAYAAQQVRAGQLPVSALPEDYGGRPTGESRRSIRMAAAYDEAQSRALEQERMRQQMEQSRLSEQRDAFRFSKEQNEYSTKLKLDALNERDAAQEASEANVIASGLEGIDFKTDPEAGLKIDQLILDNPLGAARPEVAKRIEAAKRINETYGAAATTKADQEASKANAAIINKGYAEGLTEQEIEGTKFADPKTGIVDFNYAEIERLTAQKTGERKTKEPEEEEYKPVSAAEARDRRDVVQAEFDDLSASVEKGELESDDPDYVKARARLRKAEAELKVAENAKQRQTPAQNRPVEGSGFQDTLEKLNMANDRLGKDYLNGVKRLGIDNVSDDTIKELLNVTGFNNKNELASALRDQSALDWANANPDDPRSSRIKQRLGVE